MKKSVAASEKPVKAKEFDKELFKRSVEYNVRTLYRKNLEEADAQQIFQAVSYAIKDRIVENWMETQKAYEKEDPKMVYYMSMEFLMGRALGNNLINLKAYKPVAEALEELGLDLNLIEDQEPDAALGNGGLGRLAACFLDSLATLGYPAYGCGIRYRYGMFKQEIRDGYQVEVPDNWLMNGNPFELRRPEYAKIVKFGGYVSVHTDENGRNVFTQEGYQSVKAIPFDFPIVGYGNGIVNTLRIWDAEPVECFQLDSFDKGDYQKAVEQENLARNIVEVLYPNDNHYAGKELRLKQQYFFISASVQEAVEKYMRKHDDIHKFYEKVTFQLNDTHPTLAIPEMMRILLDECGFGWDKSFDICQKVFSYTNHTVMAEALEKWNVDIFKMTLPRIYQIVVEMDRRAREELAKAFPGDQGKIDYMALIGDNQVRMANICAYTANSINGVSKLHSEIIKESVFHDYYLFKPNAFKNVTNGIAYRRWLLASNPGLCKLLDETIGDGYKHDASDLTKLNKYADDKTVLKKLNEIKLANKKDFASYLAKSTGQVIDPNSIFDCQVKRMHEYKRQHLNALNIAAQYLYLKENPNADFIPKTYIFGAKAAPGYYMAKQMIRMICKLGDLINNDPAVRDKLRVVYLEEYCVSLSEHLMPAAEVSEQISLAGTEASGTGNMKFMLNGAITLGTLDGANVEIADAAGKENELIFGMLTPEVNNLKRVGYHPNAFIMGDDVANAALNFLERGWNGENFHEVTENLRSSDPYMVMADFKDYRRAQADLQKLYADREKWAQMSLKNIANSGIFSADRAVLDYARDIWHASAVK